MISRVATTYDKYHLFLWLIREVTFAYVVMLSYIDFSSAFRTIAL
jgi:hypothetical protein